MEKNHLKHKDWIILTIIISLAFLIRLYKINTPLADFHSWRQVDTAAVGRNFIKDGFNLLYPRFDDLTSIQSNLENPNGYRFVEFPIYNAIFAFFYKILPFISIEIYARLTSIFFSLIIIGVIYYLLFKEVGRIAAISAALIYSVFPFFVFFSRVVLPETTALSFVFISILFTYLYIHEKKLLKALTLLGLAIIFFALALLTKPTTIFYGLPLFYLFVRKHNISFFKKIDWYVFFIAAIIPLFLWRLHIQKHPEGIPASSWLITSVNTYEGQKEIFFKPAFFRWIFFERINIIILGGYATALFVIGLLARPKKLFFHCLLIAILLYLLVFQGGNVQHEYYQVLILPPLAIFIGLGINFVIKQKKNFLHPILTYSLLFLLIIMAWFFSYYKVKDYYDYPHGMVQMSKIISTLTNQNDKIITDRLGDTTLLYLSNRKGAPMLYKSLEQLKEEGYLYFITDKKDYAKELKEKKIYPLIFENNEFAFFKL